MGRGIKDDFNAGTRLWRTAAPSTCGAEAPCLGRALCRSASLILEPTRGHARQRSDQTRVGENRSSACRRHSQQWPAHKGTSSGVPRRDSKDPYTLQIILLSQVLEVQGSQGPHTCLDFEHDELRNRLPSLSLHVPPTLYPWYESPSQQIKENQ